MTAGTAMSLQYKIRAATALGFDAKLVAPRLARLSDMGRTMERSAVCISTTNSLDGQNLTSQETAAGRRCAGQRQQKRNTKTQADSVKTITNSAMVFKLVASGKSHQTNSLRQSHSSAHRRKSPSTASYSKVSPFRRDCNATGTARGANTTRCGTCSPLPTGS